MRKFAILIVVIACIMLLPAMFFQRHAMACELLPVLNYQQIIDGVFVEMEDTDTSADRAKAITGLIAAASERMTDLYGAPASKPRVVITSDVQKAASWGSNETASMHRMPWRACIIIGPKGQNVDVIAHEWLHAEIQHRVGFFRFLQEIPV
ncbi:hypothetical protein [Alkalimonas sp.]|uniref:hypothetical protein n=1 Tax=Alkalimonas sp. TaxID=1872453 RepID=UPI00263AED20|nr:hypothetical protein [Alkalimonas sp.]MCC5827308.1 hypothetical protein [Alkalimonas sp.]